MNNLLFVPALCVITCGSPKNPSDKKADIYLALIEDVFKHNESYRGHAASNKTFQRVVESTSKICKEHKDLVILAKDTRTGRELQGYLDVLMLLFQSMPETAAIELDVDATPVQPTEEQKMFLAYVGGLTQIMDPRLNEYYRAGTESRVVPFRRTQ